MKLKCFSGPLNLNKENAVFKTQIKMIYKDMQWIVENLILLPVTVHIIFFVLFFLWFLLVNYIVE